MKLQTVLALDPGTQRIGIAISDPTGKIAFPLAVLAPGPQFIEELAKLTAERKIDEIVVGLPRRTSGEEGPEAAAARAFATSIEQELGIPVNLYDERFTTKAAASELSRVNVNARKQRTVVDKVAATLLLQSYLDSLPNANTPESTGGSGGVAAAKRLELHAPEAANPPEST